MAKQKNSTAGETRAIINRKARFEYELLDSWEAGIALVGSEVKSVWLGRVNMTDAYCQIKDGEVWLMSLDIEPYSFASAYKPERRRDRKLLLHRKQIDLIDRRSMEKGFAIIPTKIYFSEKGRVKVEISLARGKRAYDKRDTIAKRETQREMERARSVRD